MCVDIMVALISAASYASSHARCLHHTHHIRARLASHSLAYKPYHD
jgi:hypothetical protein